MEKTICELFAGVGGFRLGFDRLKSGWKTEWFSQWEPGKKNQWAHDCYVKHFGECKDLKGEYHTGEDISLVKKENIPDHNLLLAGFPCQDYSVAHTLSSSKGIEGKKGVLWWQIYEILEKKKPKFCIFENVDRLLKSPAKQRGRDLGIILWCLNNLGYSAEWKVVNAAEYGAAQKRRRVFIFAYKNDTKYGSEIEKESPFDIINNKGFMVKSFPSELRNGFTEKIYLEKNINEISDNFKANFKNIGYMHNGEIYMHNAETKNPYGTNLRNMLENCVEEDLYISEEKIEKWKYLKGAKKCKRNKDGHEYEYSEGAVPFPDLLDSPARTMLTSESTLNRCSHLIEDPVTKYYRILSPIECERLNGFDDDWTKETINGEMPNRMRYFCMGNALVVPMITRMGMVLDQIIANEQ